MNTLCITNCRFLQKERLNCLIFVHLSAALYALEGRTRLAHRATKTPCVCHVPKILISRRESAYGPGGASLGPNRLSGCSTASSDSPDSPAAMSLSAARKSEPIRKSQAEVALNFAAVPGLVRKSLHRMHPGGVHPRNHIGDA
jgi:hypothetical protein